MAPSTGEQPNHREDVLRATIAVISDNGYAKATVTQIAKTANIPRNRFYALFRNKEDAFCAVVTHIFWQALTKMRMDTPSDESWPEQVYLGLQELLAFFATKPQLARIVFVEAQMAGPRALVVIQKGMRDCIDYFSPSAVDAPAQVTLPESLAKQVLGAIYFRIYDAISSGDAESLPELLPEVVEIALVPYIGTQRATAVLSAHEHKQSSYSS
jgi:AcrR family transcriptional regulator